jgi:hypothetical protein
VEAVQELQREYKNLELLLQGTQRENERCMADLDRWGVHCERWSCGIRSLIRLVLSPRSKMQVKHLEQALTDLAGPNWKVHPVLNIREGRWPDERFLDRITSRSQLYLLDVWTVRPDQQAVPRTLKTNRLQASLPRTLSNDPTSRSPSRRQLRISSRSSS